MCALIIVSGYLIPLDNTLRSFPTFQGVVARTRGGHAEERVFRGGENPRDVSCPKSTGGWVGPCFAKWIERRMRMRCARLIYASLAHA